MTRNALKYHIHPIKLILVILHLNWQAKTLRSIRYGYTLLNASLSIDTLNA